MLQRTLVQSNLQDIIVRLRALHDGPLRDKYKSFSFSQEECGVQLKGKGEKLKSFDDNPGNIAALLAVAVAFDKNAVLTSSAVVEIYAQAKLKYLKNVCNKMIDYCPCI